MGKPTAVLLLMMLALPGAVDAEHEQSRVEQLKEEMGARKWEREQDRKAEVEGKNAQDQQGTQQVVAKAIPAVPGAVICPNYRAVSLMIEWYRTHWRENFQDTVTKGQSRLIRGEPISKPPLARYGCALAPAGTPMTLERGNAVPVVSAILPDGSRVRGVTDPGLIAP